MTAELNIASAAPTEPQLPPPDHLVGVYLNQLLPRHAHIENKTVLDVGSGEGRNTIAMALRGYGHVLGIDIDPESVKTAVRNKQAAGLGAKACSFIEKDALHIGGIKDDFDVVVCTETLHELESSDQSELVRLMQERTKPGGVNIISGYMLTEQVEEVPSLRARLLRPGQLGRMYEVPGWSEPRFRRDVRHPVQVVNGRPRVQAKSFLIARKAR